MLHDPEKPDFQQTRSHCRQKRRIHPENACIMSRTWYILQGDSLREVTKGHTLAFAPTPFSLKLSTRHSSAYAGSFGYSTTSICQFVNPKHALKTAYKSKKLLNRVSGGMRLNNTLSHPNLLQSSCCMCCTRKCERVHCIKSVAFEPLSSMHMCPTRLCPTRSGLR